MRKIAIICGGYSGEYEISINSAKVVKKNLDSTVYDSYVIVIKKGEWYCLTDDDKHIPVDKNDFSINIDGNKITFDAVFNAVHGIPGENGEILVPAVPEFIKAVDTEAGYIRIKLIEGM